jgi:hypothetical protein
MTFLYIGDDFQNGIRRCIRSWERQYPTAITGLTVDGKVKPLRDPSRNRSDSQLAFGRLWCVLIRAISPCQKPGAS